MNERVKKIVRNILFLLSIPLITGAFIFARVSSLNELYRGAKVHIENPEWSFVSPQEIQNLIEEEGLVPDRIRLKEINLAQVKESIEKNPWVHDVTLYLSSKQILHVSVTQRIPALRWEVKGSTGQSYYLDHEANPMPLHDEFIANVPVVTASLMGHSLEDLNYNTSLVHLANYIEQDSFWNAGIAQIDITDKRDIILIPVLGKHIIHFGTPTDIEDKMKRLYTFYKQGMRTIDWSLYDEVDARYQGQIICRNSKGLILTEDPYESHADEMERIRVKKEIEQEELRIQKQKELQEKQKALEKERLEKQAAKEKLLREQQEAKQKEKEAKQKEKELKQKEKELKQKEKEEKKKAEKLKSEIKKEEQKSNKTNQKSKSKNDQSK